MVVELRSLRISADFDAAGYSRGAQQKVAADKAMSASSKEAQQATAGLGAASDVVTIKVGNSANQLERLKIQYADGYGTAVKFNNELLKTARATDTNVASVQELEQVYAGIQQRFRLMADGTELAARGYTDLAEAITNVNNRLTVNQKLQAEKMDANSILNRAAVSDMGTLKRGANNNRPSNSFAATNAAYQLQDIVTTAALGSSPLTVALQQGPQLASAFGEAGAAGAVRTLGTALISLVSPMSLITVGLTAAAAAAIQYFAKAKDGALTYEDALKKNAEALDLIKGRYGELAKTSITSVGGNSFILSDARNKQTAIEATLRNQVSSYIGSVNDTTIGSSVFGSSGLDAVKNLQNLVGDQKQFSPVVSGFLEQVKNGHGDIAAFDKQVEDLYQRLFQTSKAPDALRQTADLMKLLAHDAFTVSGQFAPFGDALNRLKVEGTPGIAEFVDQVHRAGEEKGLLKLADELISKFGDAVNLAQKARDLARAIQAQDREDTRPGLADRDTLEGYVRKRAKTQAQQNEQWEAEQQMQNARTYAERVAAADRLSRAQKPQNADEGGGEDARARRAVQEELNRQHREQQDAADERKRQLDSSIGSQQMEISLIGKTTAEATALRSAYQLTSQIRLEAARNGVAVDEKEIAMIQQKAAELGPLCDLCADLGGELIAMFTPEGAES